MKFYIPRHPEITPFVVDRLGRNLSEHGIEFTSIGFNMTPQGPVVNLSLLGCGKTPEGLVIPWRLNCGEKVDNTRLYDHNNVELVNALRMAKLNISHECQANYITYDVEIAIRADDQIEFSYEQATK